MAKQLNALRKYYSPRIMERIGITEERHEYHQRLQKEFSEPRQKNVTAALKRKKSEQAPIAARAVPESDVKKRAFPKRRVPKGVRRVAQLCIVS